MEDGRPPTERADADPEALRREGKLIEAAAAYRRRGELATAEALYAELWDFASAAEVAHERGDRPAELGHLLSANDFAGVTRVGQALEHGTEAELRRAAAIYERHRRWTDAAATRERLGELEVARELYRRGQALLEVARLERTLGRLREAGVTYEQLLQREPDGPEAARAHLELGQLLLALDRAEEGARHLQVAARSSDAAVRPSALRELAAALDRLGYALGCEAVLDELRALVPTTPGRDAFLEAYTPVRPTGPARLGGRYELERVLGATASARVFLARDAISGRAVAVRALSPAAGARAEQRRAAYFGALRLVATLHHPNVLELLELDEPRGLVVMEYLPGGTLADRLPSPAAKSDSAPIPLPPAAVRRLVLDVLDGLIAIHGRGLAHGALVPGRIFYSATGQARLGGFGASHLFVEEATQTAGLAGALAYMAPEQMKSETAGAAADVYALGTIAFHALTGRLVFPGPDFLAQHLGETPPTPSTIVPELDPAWDALIAAMLQKAPEACPASLDALRLAVSQIAVRDDARRREAAEPTAPAAPRRERYLRTNVLCEGAGGSVFLGQDTRLGRPIVIETLSSAYLSTEAGAAHLRWLRELARLGGPRVQRLFALVPREDGGLDAIFEALSLDGTSDAIGPARAKLDASLRALHEAGVAHGHLAESIVREPHGPAIWIAGRAPKTDATVADDRAVLDTLG